MKDKMQTILVSSIIVVILAIAALVGCSYFLQDKPIEVIDFNNATVSAIDSWAKKNDIIVKYEYEYSEEIEKDTIISTSIVPNQELHKNDEITIVLSLGSDPLLEVALIDFKGYTEEQIEQFADENKLIDVSFEYEYSDEIEDKLFIRHNIESETVKRTDMIIFTMSMGKEPVEIVEIEIPDFSSYTKTEIKTWAKANGVTVKYASATSKTIEKDGFISQSVKAGTMIKKGKTITVTYSLGKPIELVDLSGKSKTDVIKWFESVDNRIEAVYIDKYSDKVEKGYVISNEPNSDTIEDGEKVKVYVSLGKPSLSDYTGKAYTSLQKEINDLNEKGAGFELSATEVDDKNVSKGNVISQDKHGTLSIGSKITVKYSKGKVITVPDGKDKDESAFKSSLTMSGLKIGTRTETYNSSVAKGKVVSNDNANKDVYEGTTINYVVSLGTYNVESMIGKTISDAQAILKVAKAKGAPEYTINSTEEYDNTTNLKKGLIFAQTIEGTTINVKVSKGQSVTVPNFVGKIRGGSVETVDNYSKFNISWVSDGYDDNKEKGEIVSQSIETNQVVDVNTSITLHYSEGPKAKCELPDLAAMDFSTNPETTKAAVISALKNQGFTNVTVTIGDFSDATPGSVVKVFNKDTNKNIDPGLYTSDYPIGVYIQQSN